MTAISGPFHRNGPLYLSKVHSTNGTHASIPQVKAFISWIYGLALSLGGPGLFAIAFLDSSFVSLPQINDILVVLMVVANKSRMPYYALMATAGSVAGCYVIYYLAKKGGEAFLRRREYGRVNGGMRHQPYRLGPVGGIAGGRGIDAGRFLIPGPLFLDDPHRAATRGFEIEAARGNLQRHHVADPPAQHTPSSRPISHVPPAGRAA